MSDDPTVTNPPAEGSAPASGEGFVPVEDNAGAAPQFQADSFEGPKSETGDEQGGAAQREETANATAWAEAATVPELLEHEAIKPDIDRIREEATEEGRSSMQSQLQPILQNQRDDYAKVAQLATEVGASWRKLARQGAIDETAMEEFLIDNKDAIQSIQGAHYSQGAEWGGRALMHEMGKEAGLDETALLGLNRQLVYAFQQQWQNQPVDMSFVKDFMGRAVKSAKAEALEEGKKLGAKMAEERIGRETTARERNGKPAAAAVGGRAASGGRADMNTVKGINAAARSGQISQTEAVEHIQRLRSGAAG